MQVGQGQATQQPDWPPPARAWALVFVLLGAYAIAFVDRQILSLLVEPVRRELAISDAQFSLLAGVAFTLFYSVMGIPCAWLEHRHGRPGLRLDTDRRLHDPAQIRVAIALLCAVVVPLGALAIALARGRFVAATSGVGD